MMASPSTPNSATVRVVIVDEDPIFRLGLRDWLKQLSNVEVVEDIGDQTIAFRRIQARLDLPTAVEPDAIGEPEVSIEPEAGGEPEASGEPQVSIEPQVSGEPEATVEPEASGDSGATVETEPSDSGAWSGTLSNVEERSDSSLAEATAATATTERMLVILGGAIATNSPRTRSLIGLCQQIKTQYPTVPVLVLGAESPTVIEAFQQTAVDGYVSKADAATQLQPVIQQVLAGEFEWPTPSLSAQTSLDDDPSPQSETPSPTPATTPAARVGPLAQLRYRWRVLALEQIEAQLGRLQPYAIAIRTQTPPTTEWSSLDRWVILGRCRELNTARWLVQKLLATPALEYLDWTGTYRADDQGQSQTDDAGESASSEPSGLLARWQRQLGAIAQQPISPSPIRPSDRTSASQSRSRSSAIQPLQTGENNPAIAPLSPITDQPLPPGSVRATLFDSLRERLQAPLLNQTDCPLEIDVLREGRKRELLVLVLHKLLALLDDLRYSDVQRQQLQERRSQLFYDLWQSILTDYFGKYYVMQVDGLELEVVTILSQDARVVQRSIFDRIPFALDLLAHFLFQSPLEIDGVPYALGTPEAFERAELILDNLVIQLGNSIIQPLLNHLADVELIKQNFYDYRCMSSRDIARFRNSLSWRYRRLQYFDEPTAIFESTHYLLTIQGMAIKQAAVYVSRRPELDRLAGIPLVVTLALELRDALSPRFREAIAAVGSAVIYVLTDVIGRGIGLIGRGIIKGIGSAWQDPK